MDQSKIIIPLSASSVTHTNLSSQALSHISAQEIFGVVLLHGLGMDTSEMDFLAKALRNQYKEKVLIINSESRVETSMDVDLVQQAKLVYEEIVAKLQAHHKDVNTFPLFILGQSQGGVITVLIEQQYKHALNLRGVVTHNAPLQGVYYLTNGPWATKQFARSLHQGLEIMGATVNQKQISIFSGIERIGLNYYGNFLDFKESLRKQPNPVEFYTGVRELLPNSSRMASITRYLRGRDKTDNVPILLIGGYENDYSNICGNAIKKYKEQNKNDQEITQIIQACNQHTAKFITGDPNGLHDYVVPLKSQLCRGDSLEDLTHIGAEPYRMDMPGDHNITSCIIKGITHCDTLFPMSDKTIDRQESMMRPSRMLPVLYQFIDENL
ncbi:hypothetical protein [Candidatus Cardinium hertigii]|nr:hypothetical protein [Candidatus Cardinium hertigii]